MAVVCTAGEGWGGSDSGSGSGSSVVAGTAVSSSGGLSISHLDHSLTDEEVPTLALTLSPLSTTTTHPIST